MNKLLLFVLFLSLCSCTDDRTQTGTVYIDVVGVNKDITSKVHSLILDDMGRFECVMPKDWSIKNPSTPCMKVLKYDEEFNSYTKTDRIVRISILEGKNYAVEHFCFNSGMKKKCETMNGLRLKSGESPTAVNFAKSIITSPKRMIGAN